MFNKYTALVNGRIITVDANDNITQALLIANDRIVATGSNAEIKALLPPGGDEVDLDGRTVIPGIIDGHVHMELTANQAVNAVNVQQPHGPNCDTLEKIYDAIKQRAAVTPKGEWITAVASNLFTYYVKDGRFPTRRELDAICPDHPLLLTSEVHRIVMNSLAMKLLNHETEYQLGRNETMARDPRTAEPTGLFTESWSYHSITPFGYDKLLNALRTGVTKLFVSRGVTSAHELSYSIDGIRAWQQLKKEGDLPLRLRFFLTHPDLIDLDQFLALGLDKDFGDDWLALGGIKFFADGIGIHANQTAYSDGVSVTEEDGPAYVYDDLKFTQEELDELVFKVHQRDLQVWTHTTTMPAMERGLLAYTRAQDRLFRKNARMRLEHFGDRMYATNTMDKYMPILKKYEIVPVGTAYFLHTFPGHVTGYKTLIREGFKPFYNSDSTGSQPEAIDPWFGIWCLVTRKDKDGIPRNPEECLTPLEAIRMATINGAWAAFEEHKKGSLEPGKLADFVVLGDDPLTCDHDALPHMPVELAVVGGRTKFSGSAFAGVLA